MSKFLYRLGHRRSATAGVCSPLGWPSSSPWSRSPPPSAARRATRFTIPGTESQKAIDLLEERFPAQSGSDARVVFAAADGTPLTDAANRRPCTRRSRRSVAAPMCVGVTDPFAAGTVSPEGPSPSPTSPTATRPRRCRRRRSTALDRRRLDGRGRRRPGASSAARSGRSREEPGHTSELIGLGVAVVVLLLSFGSLIAMGLPAATALIGVGIGDDGHHARRRLHRPVVRPRRSSPR